MVRIEELCNRELLSSSLLSCSPKSGQPDSPYLQHDWGSHVYQTSLCLWTCLCDCGISPQNRLKSRSQPTAALEAKRSCSLSLYRKISLNSTLLNSVLTRIQLIPTSAMLSQGARVFVTKTLFGCVHIDTSNHG